MDFLQDSFNPMCFSKSFFCQPPPGSSKIAEDARMELVRLVKGFEYPIEVYRDVETDDGYLLDVYRIPHGKVDRTRNRYQQPVVLIMHGVLGNCMGFLLIGPKNSLAYVLADSGYDVWLANCRGTTYSSNHKTLNSFCDKEYWNFSFHEIAIYDLSAVIKIIRKTTNCQTLSYIGYSQGATAMFVLLSEIPDFNRLFKIFICLAPVYSTANISSPIVSVLLKYPLTWKPLFSGVGLPYVPPQLIANFLKYLGNYCHSKGIIQRMVINLLFLVVGYNYKQLNKNELPKMLSYLLDTTSVKNFEHYCQIARSGQLKKFDFGIKENTRRYGCKTPPIYDLSRITCPVALFYSDGDWISARKDIDLLKQKLPNVVFDYIIGDPNFNHLDFSFATDVVKLLYNPVIRHLNIYNQL